MINRGFQTDDQNGPSTISNVDPISYIPLKKQFITRGTDPNVIQKADTATAVEVDFEILAVTGKFLHGKETGIAPGDQKKFHDSVNEFIGNGKAVGNTGTGTDVSGFINKIAQKVDKISPGKLDTGKFAAFGKKDASSELRSPVKREDRKKTTRPSPFAKSGTITEPESPAEGNRKKTTRPSPFAKSGTITEPESPAEGKSKEAAFKRKLRGDTITPKGK
jgi:hypothetical protein